MKDDSSQGGPLAGLRIIDITEVVMGPSATQMLADLGADVIKVEPPGGDMLRATGPGGRAGAGPLFLNLNRNKRSIVLDLKQPCRQGSVAEARAERRCAGLQRAAAGDEAPRARLRSGAAGEPAHRLCRHLRLQPARPLCGVARLRRPDPGRRRHSRGQRAGGIRRAALRPAQPLGPRDGPVRVRRDLRGAARARTHRPRAGGRRADVRDDRADDAGRPSVRPHVRPAARRLRLSAAAQPAAAAVRHAGRPGVPGRLHRRAVEGLHARGRRGRAVRERPAVRRRRIAHAACRGAVRDPRRQAQSQDHAGMARAAGAARHPGAAGAHLRVAAGRSAPAGHRVLPAVRASHRGRAANDGGAERVAADAAAAAAPAAAAGRAQRASAGRGRLLAASRFARWCRPA